MQGIGSKFKIVWLGLILFSNVVLFQNFSGCDNAVRFASERREQRSLGGGGEPTDGKPHFYYRWIRDYRCKGKATIIGEIQRRGSEISAKTLDLNSCELVAQPIDKKQISVSELDPNVLSFNGGIYVQRPTQAPTLSALGDPYELWCRSEDVNQIELLVRPPSLLGQRSADISLSDGTRFGPLQLKRQLRANVAMYSSDGLQLSINRTTSITSNEVMGDLKFTGVTQNAKLRCRFGSDLDSHNHFAATRQLDFFGPTLPPGISFSRASAATFINKNGLVETSVADTPRFDFDFMTGLSRGLLVERSSTNLLTQSSRFDQWIHQGVTVTANSTETLDPSGQQGAQLIRNTAAVSAHQVVTTVDLLPNRFYTYSLFVKPTATNPARYVRLQILDISNMTNTIWTNFDILQATADVVFGETDTRYTVANVERVGNGWLRVSVSGVPPSSSSGGAVPLQVFFETVPGNPSDGVYADPMQSGYYVWGGQLEESESVSSYIPTTTTAVSRSADVVAVSDLSWWDGSSDEMSIMLEKQIPVTSASPRDSGFSSDSLLDLSSVSKSLLSLSFDRTTAQMTAALSSSETVTVAIPNLLIPPAPSVIVRPIATYIGTGLLSVTANGISSEVGTAAAAVAQPDSIQLHSDLMGPSITHLQMLRYWPFKLDDKVRVDLSSQRPPQ